MNKNIVVLALLAICIFDSISAQGSLGQCKYNNIDFSRMAANNQSLKEYSFTQTGTTYIWNVCTVAPSCTQGTGGVAGAVSCQRSGTTLRSTGLLNSGQFAKLTGKPGGQITYGKGLVCNSNKQPRTTIVEMTCTPGQPTKILSVDEKAPTGSCIYEVKMSGNGACPSQTTSAGPASTTSGGNTDGGNNDSGNTDGTDSQSGSQNQGSTDDKKKKGGIGGGWIFIILLICATVVYIGAGMIINAKVRHLHGKEMFPNHQFWTDTFPGLIKDGVLFIKGKITGSGTSGYQQV
ncbi:hypothetical protein DLAC_04798 [Tieghemostelium lacteum]|uniref:Autophagy-related protein 27 n=1 Tax=Tieghemostelium lacteum TaxID=361077 RepID=A0A151ZKI7_TIELA|nr:hypothetical protein DLAC_04798 [Tieghemostelium lacteum]|eukprot:KYQ94493.1 hypothetical protein DLAC_04798 [Tieghemostelium lacteum]